MEQPLTVQKRGHGWHALAIGLLILFVPLSTTFQHGGGPMDEGTLLVYPEMVQRGAIPYRDFETFYGPANPYLLAAIYTIFGTNIGVERTVGLLYRAVILLALFGLTRRWGTPIATGCMLIGGLLLLPLGVVAYAWLAAMACALCFIWAMAAPESGRRCLFGGVLASLAMSFRPDVAPAVLLAAGVLLQPLSWRLRMKFILGGAIGLIPFTVLFFIAGPEQVFNNIFLYPVLRSGPSRRIPFSSAAPFLVRLFFAQLFAVTINIAAGIFALRARSTLPRDRVLLALALLGAGVLPQAWQRLDLYHVLFVAFLTIGILPLSLFSILSRRTKDRPPIGLALGAVAMVAVLVCAIAPVLPKNFFARFSEALQTAPSGSEFAHKGPRSFPVGPSERVVMIGRMLDQLEKLSTPGERLFVGPGDLRAAVYCDTFLYHLMPKLRPATYFLEMNPMSANRPGSRLATDIASADWLILNSEWKPESGAREMAGNGSAELVNIVRDRFRPVGIYGSFMLLQRSP
ncbi:MAG TPA: hypothetical protein VEX43_13830 [Chthoniobacterales bacterium]|nr:hypothetical protein [Chthoniobacterales bacterium]